MKDFSASTKLEIYRVLSMLGVLEISINRLSEHGIVVEVFTVSQHEGFPELKHPHKMMGANFHSGKRRVLLPPLPQQAKVEILKSIARAIDAACADEEKPSAGAAPHQSRRKGHRL